MTAPGKRKREPTRAIGYALALSVFSNAGCGGESSTPAQSVPAGVDLDALGCSSAQSTESETSPCTIDFGDCGYVIQCAAAVNGARACTCMETGKKTGEISAAPAACGAASAGTLVNMSQTKKLPEELTNAVEACGWSYRCCSCRTRVGNPLYGVDVCQ